MSEKKVVSRTTAIALSVICIILLVGAIGSFYYYNKTLTEKDTLSEEYSDYYNDHSHTNADYESLKDDYEDYVAIHSQTSSDYDSLISQISSLNSQISTLREAKVLKVGITASANDPLIGESYLRINSGYLCNVGTNNANNVKLHVVANRDAVLVIDTYVTIGTIPGESSTLLSTTDLPHDGGALTSWTITPEWT